MSGSQEIVIAGAVEGLLDGAVLRRLVIRAGALPGPVYGGNGKDRLLKDLSGYNNAAAFAPWLVLVDLDTDADCAPNACGTWLPQPTSKMCFRVVVRAIEAWLLADRETLARFLGVASVLLPDEPNTIVDPKTRVVDLARRSRRRQIREDLAPRPGSGRRVGPAYTGRLIEFVEQQWQPDRAAERSDSLRRCLRRLDELVRKR